MLARRSFLRALGLAPAAIASSATQLGGAGIKGAMGVLHEWAPPEAHVDGTPAGLADPKNSTGSPEAAYRAWKTMTGMTVPPHKAEQIARQARYVTALDPDLVAMRSYSLVMKMRIQKERNIAKRLAEVEDEMENRFKEDLFSRTFGFHVW